MFQVECHPYLTQNKLKEFCESNGILLTGYAPLGSAKRSWAGPEEDAILDEPIVKQIADKYKKTNAQILIKFQVIILLFIYFNLFVTCIVLKKLDPKRCYSHTKVFQPKEAERKF